ncbi:MAG TPA: CRTAC1 family protein, partial [Isosphaeraceae bacterium]|nr:CRTAC1 family protein [Isosphaeraceae bacterium]
AAQLRARKGELDRVFFRYWVRLFEPDVPAAAVELARQAETLSRPFDARCLWSLALEEDPSQEDARAALARPEPAPLAGPTIAGLLTEFGPDPRPTERRPTAAFGGAMPVFVDDAKAVGLAFTYDNGATRFHHLPETVGGGVGLLDFDGDGWLDVYVVQGGPFPPVRNKPAGDKLFHNKGDGTFEDVTDSSGIASLVRGYGLGVTVGDYDGDGRPDLFLSRWRSYALLRNKGDGTFEDRTEAAGLSGDRDWPTSAAFADLDGDGDLDLDVCHYAVWDTDNPDLCVRAGRTGEYEYCEPRKLPARPDHLFRNDSGRFTDVTAQAGIVDDDGRGLGVVAADFDGDHRVDLFVANDTTAKYLFLNRGGLKFEEIGHLAGVAGNAEGGYQASMGIACGDLDGDGLIDLAVTNLYNESMAFYRNLGKGVFADHTAAVGLALPTRYVLGFGTAFFDANNDGWLDLAAANGHVNDLRPEIPYQMPTQLLMGGPDGRLADVSDRAGAPWAVPRLGRGLAVGDLDNDGRLDLVIVSQNQPLAYFHNRTGGSHSLTLRLEGTTSNRDAVGAIVAVTAGGRRQVAHRLGGGSYLSASDPRLHFGLGRSERVEEVEVTWPSGRTDRYSDLPADAGYLLIEGRARPQPLTGFRRPALPAPG